MSLLTIVGTFGMRIANRCRSGGVDYMYEYFQIGRIVNTHGIKGELKVVPLTNNPERFEKLESVLLDRNNNLEKHKIDGIKYLKGFVVLKLEGVDTIEDAQAFKGVFILVDRKNAVKLPKDSFFICDLIGSEVRNVEGMILGKLTDILSTGGNDVFVIKGENGSELLLPALKSVFRKVSTEERTITVEVPEGL